MTPEEKLKRFADDVECLKPLLEYDSRLNIFRLLQIARKEVPHSNFLAWILDPNGNHGLGAQMLKKMMEKGAGPAELDWNSFTVKREWKKIDILAVSDTEKCLLCIENKIGTGEHTNQINQYRKMTRTYYPDYARYYIFLTPDGKSATDPENWSSVSYADILEMIDSLETDHCNPDAAMLIRHYADMLRRDIVGDKELKELCQQIYVKHKVALDLIYANRPNTADVYETLKRWAEEKTSKGEITLDMAHSKKSCLSFTTPAMSRILPDSAEPDSSWKTKNHYFYQIWVMDSTHDFFIQIAISTKNMSPRQQEICEKIMEFRKDVQVMGKGKEYLNPFVAMHQDYYCLTSDDIWISADQMFHELLVFEKEIEELMNSGQSIKKQIK